MLALPPVPPVPPVPVALVAVPPVPPMPAVAVPVPMVDAFPPVPPAPPLAPLAPTPPAPPVAAPASALLAQVCGAMTELFALRAGGAGAGASEVVSRYLAIPGRAELAPEAMTVVLPMRGIDTAVRRAALDRDAGWVPWLRRTVRLEFAPDGAGDMS